MSEKKLALKRKERTKQKEADLEAAKKKAKENLPKIKKKPMYELDASGNKKRRLKWF